MVIPGAQEAVSALEQRLAAAADDTERAELCFQMGNELSSSDPARARQSYLQAIDISRRIGDGIGMKRCAVKAAEGMVGAGLTDWAAEFRLLIKEAADISPRAREQILGSHDEG